MALIHLQNLKKNPHHKTKDQTYIVKTLAVTHSTETIYHPAAGSGEGGHEQEDMAYRGLVAFSIPMPGPQHNP
jgi:hypothetical protein